MVKKLILLAGILAAIGFAIFWFLTLPTPVEADRLSSLPQGNVKAGEQVFWAGGCASCHAAPKAVGDAKLLLTGGVELKTPFGIFRAPNLSPDPVAGIGSWSISDFANAMWRGVSPKGQHYFPAFPYTSYIKMSGQDLADLWAFLQQLPKSDNVVAEHDIAFPFNIRRGLGLWKLLYLSDKPLLNVGNDPILLRGQYLVEAVSHCGECHTPRNAIGGIDRSRWLAGGVSPDGKERIPNITPHKTALGGWSQDDIVNGLETGFTPEFDSFGSSMAEVQENMARLPKADLEAIAAYLKAVFPVAKLKK